MKIKLEIGTSRDVGDLVLLRNAVSHDLTSRYGNGHWTSNASERGVLFQMTRARVYIARYRGLLVATLALSKRKPWAIDTSYFSKCGKPLYLVGMAVLPAKQRQGIGKRCLEEAARIARAWPADAIRLDAFDADAGAGGFYARCGYREVGRASYRNTPLIYYELLLGNE